MTQHRRSLAPNRRVGANEVAGGGDNFRDSAAMCGVVRFPLVAVQNFPAGKIFFQLAGTQTVRTVLFAGFGQVYD